MYCNIHHKRVERLSVEVLAPTDEPRQDQRPVATPTERPRDSEKAPVSPSPTDRVTVAEDVCIDGMGSEEEAHGYGHGV
jgi:hypothetical protein